MKEGRLMEQYYQGVKPEMQENEISPLSCFDILLKVCCIEMKLR